MGELTLDDVYTASYRRLVAQLHAVTGNRQEAEDVVQEAFMRAMPRWEQVRGYESSPPRPGSVPSRSTSPAAAGAGPYAARPRS